MMRAVGYCRVSTDEQGDSGLGLDAQKSTIRREVDHRGWVLETMYADVASGKSMTKRPDLTRALGVLAAGKADVLVVAKLDRLSRSVPDFASVLARSYSEEWALNVCDLGVDTTTPNGKMVAQIMMVLAEWEREVIGARTRDALAAARDRGTVLGRPASVSVEAEALIRVLRGSGHSYRAVARTLNDNRVPTAQGGREWYPSTVKAIERRMARD
jgi:DNA invertase Pin-like site-specific DNA recombinase